MISNLIAGCGVKSIPKNSVGVDINKKFLELNKRKSNDSAFFVLADIKKLPFKNNIFHKIQHLEVLEHIKDKKTVLGELSRVGKKGSLLELSASLKEFDTILGKLSKNYNRCNTQNFHKHCVSGEQIIALTSNYYIINKIKYIPALRWLLICKMMDWFDVEINESGELDNRKLKYLNKLGMYVEVFLVNHIFFFINNLLNRKLDRYAKSIYIICMKK